ncbi:MAG: 4-hydroxy-3-methylbut-2-enyl diphosphate reductase [Lachnospiraceae bacterium]|jgi:4-hydroxy-3-methylbut-2-enyl diphosphate reductase|nr:4-hydroxy-3-methylbut-2-enyl diphosphate reductase [Lachnospiraceae bacterium]MBQ5561269.1 4-hydroxy-3-methylbut-2-enyl diphosphate reductase [Lachnospiraceae bacterium]
MEVTLAKNAGFCFGVKRAVDMVYEEAEQHENVYTYGPIIHNEEVVEDLRKKGVHVVNTVEEIKQIHEGTMIIRSHGVSKEIYDLLEQQGLRIVDATCPFVKKIHNIVKEHTEQGEEVIIIGNAKHPEVEGIKGWGEGNVVVIETLEEANNYEPPADKKVCIVSQTTFNYKKFQDLVEIISKKRYDIIALNTICNATEVRQSEAMQLAKISDAMIVIGGKTSSNTQKLYEICKKECKNTYYIQTLVDLDMDLFQSFRSVGITAGASTPNNIIKEVQIACQNRALNKC